MKLIVLLVVFAATIVVTNADPPLLFKTDFTCREHKGRWCAVAYFFEYDRISNDDPILYFRFCTTNETKTISILTDPLGGDSGSFFSGPGTYEIGYKIFHTCSESGISCSHHRNFQDVPQKIKETVTVHTALHWPEDSFDDGSVDCYFPDAFVDLEKLYTFAPNASTDYVKAMKSIKSDKIIYWSPFKTGSI